MTTSKRHNSLAVRQRVASSHIYKYMCVFNKLGLIPTVGLFHIALIIGEKLVNK